jgi:WXG100 family type VII secretion target
MSSPKVRADYEELRQVVSTFKRAGDATGRSLHAVRREKDVLQGGDWIGQGATAFYKEMDDSVLPTLKRLTSALDSAANTTNQIIGVMQQAEEDAAAVLNGSGLGGAGGSGGAFGAAAEANVAAGIAAAIGGASGATAGEAAGMGVALGAGGAAGVGVAETIAAAIDGASGAAAGAAGGAGIAPAIAGASARLTNALNTLDTTVEASVSTQAAIQDSVQDIKIALDSMSEMGETESLRLQMSMDRLSKMMSTLSNLLKKISDTSATLTQNLK